MSFEVTEKAKAVRERLLAVSEGRCMFWRLSESILLVLHWRRSAPLHCDTKLIDRRQ